MFTKRIFAAMLIAGMMLVLVASAHTALALVEDHLFNNHDTAQLKAFFEQADAAGVKNGDKLFENYSPDDVSTWNGHSYFDGGYSLNVVWNTNGRVEALCLGSADHELCGTLDVSLMTDLVYLECRMSKLSALNAEGCTALEDVEVNKNEITSLELDGCTSLEYLDVSYNKLTELDLAGQTKLKTLYADNNKLTKLLVPEECAALNVLSCRANEIAEAEINADVEQIDLSGDPLVKLHICPRGNEVDITSDGHGAFDCVFVKDAHDEKTGEAGDYLCVKGSPEKGYEYKGLYDNGELAIEPDATYLAGEIESASLTAVFETAAEGSDQPAVPVTGTESIKAIGAAVIAIGAMTCAFGLIRSDKRRDAEE